MVTRGEKDFQSPRGAAAIAVFFILFSTWPLSKGNAPSRLGFPQWVIGVVLLLLSVAGLVLVIRQMLRERRQGGPR